MKIRSKILIDRLVGLPLARVLNLAARVLGQILRRDHSISRDNIRSIVVSKYVGMGSILQATPLIRSLRAAYPEAELIVVTGVTCRRLVERLEHVRPDHHGGRPRAVPAGADDPAHDRAVDAGQG